MPRHPRRLAARLLGLLLTIHAAVAAAATGDVSAVAPERAAGGGAMPEVRFVEVQGPGEAGDSLAEAKEVAVSPDGRHVYVTGGQPGGGAVAVFARDATNGKLQLVEAQHDSFGPVAGLDGARGIAVSPDGAHVYVVANGVVVFARNVTTGQLTFVADETDDGPTDALLGAAHLAISPDGRQVYVTGAAAMSMVAYDRDPATGRLTYLQTLTNWVEGVIGLLGAWDLVVSPDGANVYVTGSSTQSVAVFARDALSGRLTFVEVVYNGLGGVQGLLRAWGIAISPDGAQVYVVGRDQGSLVVFARDRSSGRLRYVGRERNGVGGVAGIAQPWSVAVSPDGSRVFASGHSDGAVAIFGRNAATGKLRLQQALRDGSGGVDGLAGAEGLAVSPDGVHLYVAGDVDNALAVFTTARRVARLGIAGPSAGLVEQPRRFSASAADCAPTATWTWDADGGVVSGTGSEVVIHWTTPGTKVVSVRNDGCRRAVGSVAVEIGAGELRTLRVVRRGPGASQGRVRSSPAGIDCGGAAGCVTALQAGTDIQLSATPPPGGTVAWGPTCPAGHLVLSADAVCSVQLGRVPLDFAGALTVRDPGAGDLWDVSSPAVSLDGSQVYVAQPYGGAIAVLARDTTTGALRFVASEGNLDGGRFRPYLLALSPDGGEVYALDNAAVAVFTRDAASGRLTLLQVLREGVDGVTGINGAGGIASSPDGANLYVTGGWDDAVAVFARAPDGRLRFVAAVRNGVDGVVGLHAPTGVAVSPDGANVYVFGGYAFGSYGSSVAIFGRDPTTGALRFVDALTSGDGETSYAYRGQVAVSPDGRHVYTIGDGELPLASYARDPASGRLTAVAVVRDGLDGVDGLAHPTGVAISTDGSRLYVVASDDSSLAVFARNAASGALTYLGLERDGIAGVDGLAGAGAVALSADGRHVYAAGSEGLAGFAVTGVATGP